MTYAELTDLMMATVKYSFMNADIMFTDGTNPRRPEEMAVKKIHRHWNTEGKLILEIEMVNICQNPEPIEYGEEAGADRSLTPAADPNLETQGS